VQQTFIFEDEFYSVLAVEPDGISDDDREILRLTLGSKKRPTLLCPSHPHFSTMCDLEFTLYCQTSQFTPYIILDASVSTGLVNFAKQPLLEKKYLAALLCVWKANGAVVMPDFSVHEIFPGKGLESQVINNLLQSYEKISARALCNYVVGKALDLDFYQEHEAKHSVIDTEFTRKQAYVYVLKMHIIGRIAKGLNAMESFIDWAYNKFVMSPDAIMVASTFFGRLPDRVGAVVKPLTGTQDQKRVYNAAMDLAILMWMSRMGAGSQAKLDKDLVFLTSFDQGLYEICKMTSPFSRGIHPHLTTLTYFWSEEEAKRLEWKAKIYTKRANHRGRAFGQADRQLLVT
jgi:hypothetical protein